MKQAPFVGRHFYRNPGPSYRRSGLHTANQKAQMALTSEAVTPENKMKHARSIALAYLHLSNEQVVSPQLISSQNVVRAP